MNISTLISKAKSYMASGLDWLKVNGEYKIMGAAGLVGLLTFSSWASFFLALLIGTVYYIAKNKMPQTFLGMLNINFDKYVINILMGFIIASLILFIL